MEQAVRAASKEVLRELGIGHTEAIYRNALAIEIRRAGFSCQCEVPMPIFYKGDVIGCGVADVFVRNYADILVVELKAVGSETASPFWIAQLKKYVQSLRERGEGNVCGMVVNFAQNARSAEPPVPTFY